jgi:serine/threonine-protein kinase RIO1
VERRLGDRRNLLAAKRYRAAERRQFQDDSRTARPGGRATAAPTTPSTRDPGRRGVPGREQWVANEFAVLGRLWSAGVAVPYPVQRIDSELMVEYLGDDDGAAPRLVQVRPDADQAADLFAQAVANIRLCARRGVVHGDLSPYNMLVWAGRLFLIDFPQAVDPVTHPDGFTLLERDVINVCQWAKLHGVAWTLARCSQRSWLKCSERLELRRRPARPTGDVEPLRLTRSAFGRHRGIQCPCAPSSRARHRASMAPVGSLVIEDAHSRHRMVRRLLRQGRP